MARTTPRGTGRYTALVRLAKIVLPLAALATIGAIFLAGQRRQDAGDLLSPAELATLGAGLRLQEPRFSGQTEAGEPYTLAAVSATPESAMPDRIDLESPRGELLMENGREIDGRSVSGRLDRADDRLMLRGDVVIETSDGYRFETEQLDIDLARRAAHSPVAIRGTGPSGSIEAGNMRLERGETGREPVTIFFEERVRVIFIPEARSDGAGTGPER